MVKNLNAPIPLHALKDKSTVIEDNLSPELRATYLQLLHCFDVPTGQYGIAKAVYSAALSYLAFCRDAPTFYNARAGFAAQVAQLADALRLEAQLDRASPEMVRRIEKDRFAAWALALRLQPHCSRLLVALGGALAVAMETNTKLQKTFCKALSTDADSWPDADAQSPPDEEWLAGEQFGQRWKAAETRNWQRLSLHLKSQGIDLGAPPELSTLKGALIAKAHYTSLNHIECQLDRHHLMPEELRSVMEVLKRRVVTKNCASSTLHCFRLLFDVSEDLLRLLPVTTAAPEMNGELAMIDLSRGCMRFNLDAYFEHRAKVPDSSAALFHQASCEVRTPLPAFLLEALKVRWKSLDQSSADEPDAGPEAASLNNRPRLNDLLNASASSPRSTALVPKSNDCALPRHLDLAATFGKTRLTEGLGGFKITLARASRSLPVLAARWGVPKGIVATATWDFGLVNEARHYYTRVRAAQVVEHYGPFMEEFGWPATPSVCAAVEDYGSRIVLKPEAIQTIFQTIDTDLESLPRGPRMTMESLAKLHNAMARSCIVRISFCLGLRQAAPYRLTADRITTEMTHLVIKDKQRADDRLDRPVPLPPLVVETMRMWQTHCDSLLQRLLRMAPTEPTRSDSEILNESPAATSSSSPFNALIRHLKAIQNQRPVPLYFLIQNRDVVPIGSRDVWGGLPPHLACAANVGRHFWASELLARGAPSICIDLFLRHHAAGHEFNDGLQPIPLAKLLRKVSDLQGKVLDDLNLKAPIGLSKGQA